MTRRIILLIAIGLFLCSNISLAKPYKMVKGTIVYKTPKRPAGQQDMLNFAAEKLDTVRVGFVGLGSRGFSAIKRWVHLERTRIVALCDLEPEHIIKSKNFLNKAGYGPVVEYCNDPEGWKALCQRDDINLVYICTGWQNHASIAKYAMECGKHVAIEVPAALTIAEIWDLINTSERTRKHCMQLENCVYDFFEMTCLNMAQQGLFGEVLRGEGAYIHNLEKSWSQYHKNWRLKYNREHRGDVYPTHGLGPIAQVMNIHRGDRMVTLVAMDTKAITGAKYWKKVTGEECTDFANGDQSTTLIRTHNGKVIQLNHNVLTPRQYSRDYALVGTSGYVEKYPTPNFIFDSNLNAPMWKTYLQNINNHKYISEKARKQLMEKYKHPITAEIEQKARKVGGHGGMDFIMDYRLCYCLLNGLPLDMDVYDLAEWCCPIELSEVSIKHNSAPVAIPDFTRGGWNKINGFRHAIKQ